jgi:23S rRNA (cytosine1962-C5)-methyltransferase
VSGASAGPAGDSPPPPPPPPPPPSDDPYQQLANRIARVQRHRRKWGRRRDISCWRVYERDIADQPAIVDWYGDAAVAWAFERARNDTPAQEAQWLEALADAVCRGLAITRDALQLKRRAPQRGRDSGEGQYQRLDHAAVVRTVREQGLSFEVNLSDYLDTGLFLDHRWTRAQVREQSKQARVLNLFGYTGSFTCYAAAGGARATVTVDLSNTYLAWAARNLALNRFAVDDGRHALVRADCLAWLAEPPVQEPFDLIVCDPPTFSNSKAMTRDFAVERDHPWVIARCRALLRPGGVLWFSTNCRGFQLSPEIAGWAIEDASEASIPEDFRDRRIHRLWRLVRQDAGAR